MTGDRSVASATGTLVNTATVAAPVGVTDPTPANNSATDTDTLTRRPTCRSPRPTASPPTIAGHLGDLHDRRSQRRPIGGHRRRPSTDTFPASLTVHLDVRRHRRRHVPGERSGNINTTVNLPVGATVTFTVTGLISAAATGTLANTATVAAARRRDRPDRRPTTRRPTPTR